MGKCQHGTGTTERCQRDSWYCSPGSTTKQWCEEHGLQRGGTSVYKAKKELEPPLQSPIVKKKKNQARAATRGAAAGQAQAQEGPAQRATLVGLERFPAILFSTLTFKRQNMFKHGKL